MPTGTTTTLPPAYDLLAPDGSEVRILLSRPGGSMAHFRLPAGQVSHAVRHRTVEEIWYILSGNGEMWQAEDSQETIMTLAPGVCLTIPVGVSFQFRSTGTEPLAAVAITMPPWPGDTEAETVDGRWNPTVGRPA